MKKRILAFILALIFCLSLLPAGVLAEESEADADTPETATGEDFSPGETPTDEAALVYPPDEEYEEPEVFSDEDNAPAFNPYVFDDGGDTVSVQLQPELMNVPQTEEKKVTEPEGTGEEPEGTGDAESEASGENAFDPIQPEAGNDPKTEEGEENEPEAEAEADPENEDLSLIQPQFGIADPKSGGKTAGTLNEISSTAAEDSKAVTNPDLSAPTGLEITDLSDSNATLTLGITWNEGENIESYDISVALINSTSITFFEGLEGVTITKGSGDQSYTVSSDGKCSFTVRIPVLSGDATQFNDYGEAIGVFNGDKIKVSLFGSAGSEETATAEETFDCSFGENSSGSQLPAPVVSSAKFNENCTAVEVEFTTTYTEADCFEVSLFSETEQSDFMRTMQFNSTTYYAKGMMTVPVGENTGKTNVKLNTPIYYGNNALPENNEVIYVTVELMKNSEMSDPSNPVVVSYASSSGETVQAPANFRIEPSSINSTDAFFVNLSWDSQSEISAFEIEDILLNQTISINHYEGSPKLLLNCTASDPMIGQYFTEGGRSFYNNYGVRLLQNGQEQLYEPGNGHTYANGILPGDEVTIVIKGTQPYLTPASNATIIYNYIDPVPKTNIDSGTVIQRADHNLATNTTTVVFKTKDTSSRYYELWGLTEENLGPNSMHSFNITGVIYNARAVDSLDRNMNTTYCSVSAGNDGTVTVIDKNIYYGDNAPFQKGETVYIAVQTEKGMKNDSVSPLVLLNITNIIQMTPENTQINLENSNLTYTGSWVEPKVLSVICEGKELVKGQDYEIRYENNLLAGSGAKVIADGRGDYTGSVGEPFNIDRVSLNDPNSNITAVLPQNVYAYRDGNPVKPEPVVLWNGQPLSKDNDYSLDYKNNRDITDSEHPAFTIVGGMMNFNGTTILPFDIQRFSTVKFDTAGGTMIPDQDVVPGGLAMCPEDPARDGSLFYWWYTDESFTEKFDFNNPVSNETVTLHARYAPETISFGQDYLLMNLTDSSNSVNMTTNLGELQKELSWITESGNNTVITVNSMGEVTAVGPGTDFVIASLDVGSAGVSLTARCRVDVFDPSMQQDTNITAVLPANTVTSEVYKTVYTRFQIVLKLEQNLRTKNAALGNGTGIRDGRGIAILEAEFVGSEKNDIREAFHLRVADDRDLEIIPNIDFNDPNYKDAVKAIKGTYKSSIRLRLSNGAVVVTPELTVKVKKSLPSLKANAVTVNGFIDGQTVPVVITGGELVTPTVGLPIDVGDFATLNPDLTVTVKPGVTKGGKATVTLQNCALRDWAVPATLKLTVNNSYKAPKVTLKPDSLTLNPNVADRAETILTVTPLQNVRHIITLENNDGLDIEYNPDTQRISVARGTAAAQKDAYAVAVKADGRPVATLKVKVQSANIKLTVKATGAVDTTVKNSPVTLTVTGTNYNAAAGGYNVTLLRTPKKGAAVNVTDRFVINRKANVITITERETGSLVNYVKDNTYTAVITPQEAGIPAPAAVKFTVKTSAPNNVIPSITLKATGSIDVLRHPGATNEIVITPTVNHLYDYDLSNATLNLNNTLFDWTEDQGRFIVRAKEGVNINVNSKQKETISLTIGDVTSKEINLPLKMGSFTLKQSATTVTLSKIDRFDRQIVKLSLTDSSLYDIGNATVIPVYDKNGEHLEVNDLGNGEFAIGYKDNKLPANFKDAKVKLNVTLLGNDTGKANKTISINVKYYK